MQQLCSVPGCTGKRVSLGWCRMHYNRWYNRGSLEPLPPPRQGCSVSGCTNKHNGHGFCQKHLIEHLRATDPRQQFRAHMDNAKRRGIPFHFTFEIWWEPYWHLRGTGSDQMCMARFDDQGAYEPGNVQIITNAENNWLRLHPDWLSEEDYDNSIRYFLHSDGCVSFV